MKGELSATVHHGQTHYWTRCGCGILRKCDKKEMVNFSCPAASPDLVWGEKMGVVMKGGEMFGIYLDGLLQDQHIVEGAYDHECVEVTLMRDAIRDRIADALSALA